MTYKDQFVAEVKWNGKILRIKDDTVYLPFGSDYSLFLKNLSSRKASVKVHIDGQDVLDYSALIIQPNSSAELEGFLTGMSARNKFRFVQKTEQIQEHRGDKIDDGLIRIEFAFEKPQNEITLDWCDNSSIKFHADMKYVYRTPPIVGNGYLRGKTNESTYQNQSVTESRGDSCFVNQVQEDSLGIETISQPLTDEGITVKGAECDQSFNYGSIGQLEESNVIIIQMKGLTEKNKTVIQKPITVKTKLTCSICGTKSKSSCKFCSNCGTFLE